MMKKEPLVTPAEDLAGVNNQLKMLKKAFDVIYVNAATTSETDDVKDSLQRQVKCCFAKIK